MKSKKLLNSSLLLIAALVWGFSFVIQQLSGDISGPYTFNGTRMFVGALAVFIATRFLDKAGFSHKPETKQEKKTLWLTGIVCGVFLTIASNLQQVALNLGASAGKAGFLTACYILLVPIIGLFFKTKCGWNLWVAVAIALVGLYFLCIKGEFAFELQDVLLLCCALAFALQIVTIDRFGSKCDSLRLSCIQFLVTGVLTFIPTIFFEIIPGDNGFAGWLSTFTSQTFWLEILYMGILSCGIGYTLQIIGQKGLNPAIASLVMSLESVFSLLFGWLVFRTAMDARELVGSGLMFLAICLAQINFKSKKKAQ